MTPFTKFYVGFSTVLVLVFFYANFQGWSLWHSIQSGSWSPQGRTTFQHK